MVNHRSYFRLLLPPAFSLLVLVSNWHCQVGAAAAITAMVSPSVYQDGSPSLPLELPSGGCENESGCMCRGATLAVSVDAAPFAPQVGDWLASPSDEPTLVPVMLVTAAQDADFFRSPPLSGRILRARLVSFLN